VGKVFTGPEAGGVLPERSLKETLDWIHTAFPESSTEFEVSEGVTREVN
jgi:hypothetical protein